MTCQSNGRSPTVAIGFGPVVVASRMRIPRPPQNSTTFTASPVPSDRLELGDRKDELSAPGSDVVELFDDLVAQVPRQNEHVIGPRLGQAFGRVDRDVRARQELALFERTPIDGVLDEVRADAAVVQQSVALAGRAVSGDR